MRITTDGILEDEVFKNSFKNGSYQAAIDRGVPNTEALDSMLWI